MRDRTDGIGNGDMHDRHGTAGAPRTELFAKDALLARLHRSVVQSSCVERDLVPAMHRVDRTATRRRFGDIAALEARTVGFVKISWLRLREGRKAKAESEKECEHFHTLMAGTSLPALPCANGAQIGCFERKRQFEKLLVPIEKRRRIVATRKNDRCLRDLAADTAGATVKLFAAQRHENLAVGTSENDLAVLDGFDP